MSIDIIVCPSNECVILMFLTHATFSRKYNRIPFQGAQSSPPKNATQILLNYVLRSKHVYNIFKSVQVANMIDL